MIQGGVPHSGYQDWVIGAALSDWRAHGESSGDDRTLGPLPPDTPFPQNVRYLAYYGSYPGLESAEGWMWASVLYKMGFDWQKLNDRRVWIYKYVPVEGE